MNKYADWDVNLQTDNGPLPVKGDVNAKVSLSPETAAVVGAAGGGTLGYLLGPEHKGWRALTTLAGAMLGGTGTWYATTKLASVHKEAREKQYAPKGSTSKTNIGTGQQSAGNPVTNIFRSFTQPRYAGDPTGNTQYQVDQNTFKNMSTAWQQYKASPAYVAPGQRPPARGYLPQAAPAPSFMKPRQK